jgi:hypothetical protein
VAWINVDGSIDIPGARGLKPSLQDGDFSSPTQSRRPTGTSRIRIKRAWTMELELRPFKENF